MQDVTAISNLLGGTKTLGRTLRTYEDLLGLVEAGIPKASLTMFIEKLTAGQTFPDPEAIRKKLVSDSAFHHNERFRAKVAEHIIRLAALRATAEAVIGNNRGANDFIFRRHPELADQSPFDVSGSEIGACQVETILKRAAFGLPT